MAMAIKATATIKMIKATMINKGTPTMATTMTTAITKATIATSKMDITMPASKAIKMNTTTTSITIKALLRVAKDTAADIAANNNRGEAVEVMSLKKTPRHSVISQ